MFEVITFNPADVFLNIAGYNCVGWNEISIERKSKNFRPIKGIRGKSTRVRDRDSSAIVNISLMQVSPTNDVLSQILEEDLELGTGRIDLLLVDKSGNSVFKSSEAYIDGYPKISYKDSVETAVWTFECQSTDTYFVGGNARPNNALLDLLGNI